MHNFKYQFQSEMRNQHTNQPRVNTCDLLCKAIHENFTATVAHDCSDNVAPVAATKAQVTQEQTNLGSLGPNMDQFIR